MDDDLHQLPAAAHLVGGPKLLARGLFMKCAVCGGGRLFKGWFNIKPHCPSCGFDFNREPGWYIGAMIMNTAGAMGAFVFLFAAGVWLTWPNVPWNSMSVVIAILVGIFPVVFYPVSKTLWLAVDILLHRMETGLH